MSRARAEVAKNIKSVMASKLQEEEFYKQLPRKRCGAAALIANTAGQYLAVKPAYRDDGWLLPGGIVEHNESPSSAVAREVKEEVGLSLSGHTLRAIDYRNSFDFKGDLLIFIFESETLNETQARRLAVGDNEIVAMRWFAPEEFLDSLISTHGAICKHIFATKKDNAVILLENEELT